MIKVKLDVHVYLGVALCKSVACDYKIRHRLPGGRG
jgi:hypothetical protein